MRKTKHAVRAFALPLVALLVAGCGGGNGLPDLDPDQALIYVENDMSDARFVTVAVEDMDGRSVILGNVRHGDAKNFTVMAPDFNSEIRLVAVAPNDRDRDDQVISEPFTVNGGFKVNWFLPTNRIEVSDDDVGQ